MNVLRSAIYTVYMFGGSTLLALLYLPALILPRAVMAWCIRVWGFYVCFGLRWICGIKVEVRGTPPQGPALIAGKHQSMLDICGQLTVLPDISFVMKKELMIIPLMGWYCLKNGMIVVNREGGAGALRKLVADNQDRMRDDRQVVIFPEGTRTRPGEQGDYKPGIAALYRDLGIPCVPCATNSGMHWPAKGLMRYPGTVVFEYLEPIPAGLKRGQFMSELETRIEAASLKLYEENP